MTLLQLHEAIAAVCPIHGVDADGNIAFAPEATQAQKAAAVAVRDAFVPTDPVPSEVTPYQARIALLQAGYLDTVEALMANPETPTAARIAWEYATVIQRHSSFINALAPALGLTEAQVDDLFRAAAQVV